MPSSGTRCPGVGNDTDDGKGEEDIQSGQNGTGQRKGMQYGHGKSTATEDEKVMGNATEERTGNGKGKGNGIGKGIVKQTPQEESRRSGVRAAGSKRNGTRRADSSRYI